MDRQDALRLMHEYTNSESLRKHMCCVETAMRAYAERFGEDRELWGMTGLLHDFDYERYPTTPDHPVQGSRILESLGYPPELRRAILGHAEETGTPRDTLMARALFACDELCGFIVACALVKPDKRVDSVEVTTVMKKMKDKGFARNVRREDIIIGAAELGVPLEDHVAFVIQALRANAPALGL